MKTPFLVLNGEVDAGRRALDDAVTTLRRPSSGARRRSGARLWRRRAGGPGADRRE
jgi:hypothetical protein